MTITLYFKSIEKPKLLQWILKLVMLLVIRKLIY